MIKIIKVKPWMIKFKIDNKVYFIKDASEDGEELVSCYEFIQTDIYGHYVTKHISSKFGLWSVYYFLGTFKTYSQINVERFITKLIERGLISLDLIDKTYYRPNSLIEEEIEKLEREISMRQKEIEKLKAKLK